MTEKPFLPFYPWFPRDFALSPTVRSMTPLGRAAYRELLDLAWIEDGLEHGDPARYERMLGLPEAAFVEALSAFQPDEQGRLRNLKLEEVRVEAVRFKASQSEKGKRSAEARSSNRGSTTVQPRSTTVDSGSTMHKHMQKQKQMQKHAGALPPNPPRAGAREERPWAAALDKHLGGLEDRAGWEQACSDWAAARRAHRHKALTASGWALLVAKWAPLGLDAFRASVQQSASQGWQGLFEPKGGRPAPTPETSERARMEREGLMLFGGGNGRVIDVQPS